VTLGAPVFLHLLWLLPPLALLLVMVARARRRALGRLFGAGILARVVPEVALRQRSWRDALAVAGVALLALAAAALLNIRADAQKDDSPVRSVSI
jgi:hypothetical protein